MDAIVFKPHDNVALALRDLKKNETIKINYDGQEKEIILHDDVPFGHKLALVSLNPGDLVIKHGFPIGKVSKPVTTGAWIHTHNLISQRAICRRNSH